MRANLLPVLFLTGCAGFAVNDFLTQEGRYTQDARDIAAYRHSAASNPGVVLTLTALDTVTYRALQTARLDEYSAASMSAFRASLAELETTMIDNGVKYYAGSPRPAD